MNTDQPSDTRQQPSSRVLYTCWPFEGWLCGVATMGIGLLLLVDHYLDAAPEVLWGIGLIVLGGIIAVRTRDRGAW